jgi:hypothetical protein
VKNASGFEESRILWTCAFGPWEVRNLDKRYDCGHIKEGRVNHESSRRVKQEFSGTETPKTRNPEVSKTKAPKTRKLQSQKRSSENSIGIKMSFVLVGISYKYCGLFVKV